MEGHGYPMVASHDPRLVEIAGALAHKQDRAPDTFEYQMLYGIRPEEQKRIADRGTGCGSTSRTARNGMATWCAGWLSVRPTPWSSCVDLRPRAESEESWRVLREMLGTRFRATSVSWAPSARRPSRSWVLGSWVRRCSQV